MENLRAEYYLLLNIAGGNVPYSYTRTKAGAPRSERWPVASSNITDFRLWELQNRRRKCRFVKVLTEILTLFPAEIR